MTLALAFACAATLKAEGLTRADGTADVPRLFRSPSVGWAMSGVDLLIAAGLVTRMQRYAASAALLVAVGGGLLAVHAAFSEIPRKCGCLGRLEVTPFQHAALSLSVALLSAAILTRVAAPQSE